MSESTINETSFYCTRCKKDVAGAPARQSSRSRLCGACVEREREKNRESSRKHREKKKRELKKEAGKTKIPSDTFICTRCGRPCFGSPALDGPKRKVCQMCVNQQQQRARTEARKRSRALRERERAAKGTTENERICERCGETKYIYAFNKMGRGRSRWCSACEERFGRFDNASRRKLEGGADAGDMAAEMAARQRDRKRGNN